MGREIPQQRDPTRNGDQRLSGRAVAAAAANATLPRVHERPQRHLDGGGGGADGRVWGGLQLRGQRRGWVRPTAARIPLVRAGGCRGGHQPHVRRDSLSPRHRRGPGPGAAGRRLRHPPGADPRIRRYDCFVLMTITPLPPRLPYRAVLAASRSTWMYSMSRGVSEKKFPPAGVSSGMPLTTNSGSCSLSRLVVPRI